MKSILAELVRDCWKLLCLAASCVLAAESFAQVATIEEERYFDVVVGASVRNESNLFRSAVRKERDTIGTGYIGLRVDRFYAQQRLQFDITQTQTKYDQNPQLDFRGLSYNGAWFWQLGTRLSGTLRAGRIESQVPFEDTLGTQRNIRITENYAFALNWWATGGWYLIGSVGKDDQTSDQSVRIQPDFQSSRFDAGIRYLFPSGTSVSAVRRTINGDYVNPVGGAPLPEGDYREDQSEISVTWRPSGASALTGRLAWLERDNSDPARRDFAGPSTEITYSWTPTGRLTVSLTGSRNTGPLQDSSFSYTETNNLSFVPTWQISPVTALNLRLERSDLRYRGSGPIPPIGPARRDTSYNALLGLNWTPLRRLTINTSLRYQDRSSNIPLQGYDGTVAAIDTSLRF